MRSQRVENAFSGRWSFAREDFERKLYHKRSKVKIRFVELTDTIPVQGLETEVEDGLVFADFLALPDERERQVVILLNRGMAKIGDVAALGYKDHSPVSKQLARIRAKAAQHLGELDPRDDDGFARILGQWTRQVPFWPGSQAGPAPSSP